MRAPSESNFEPRNQSNHFGFNNMPSDINYDARSHRDQNLVGLNDVQKQLIKYEMDFAMEKINRVNRKNADLEKRLEFIEKVNQDHTIKIKKINENISQI